MGTQEPDIVWTHDKQFVASQITEFFSKVELGKIHTSHSNVEIRRYHTQSAISDSIFSATEEKPYRFMSAPIPHHYVREKVDAKAGAQCWALITSLSFGDRQICTAEEGAAPLSRTQMECRTQSTTHRMAMHFTTWHFLRSSESINCFFPQSNSLKKARGWKFIHFIIHGRRAPLK